MPAQQPKISLCMIVKNEETNLPTCLESVKGLFDEIIIVDTGSTDRTKEIALQYGAIVSDFEWIDDFSAARNRSLDLATGQWIFWLDADHRVNPENARRLKGLFEKLRDEKIAYAMYEKELPVSSYAVPINQIRLFPNDPRLKWEYRVHEQIVSSLEKYGYAFEVVPIIIEHSGFINPLLKKQKIERNLHIIEDLIAKDAHDAGSLPHYLFNLSRCYSGLERYEDAISTIDRALQIIPPNSRYYPIVLMVLMRIYQSLEQWENALNICERAIELMPNNPELIYEQSRILEKLGKLAKAKKCLSTLVEQSQTLPFYSMPPPKEILFHNLAVLSHKEGNDLEAEQMWELSLDVNPNFSPSWVALMNLWISQKKWKDALTACQHAKSLDSNDHELLYKESQIWVNLSNLSKAQECLRLLLYSGPKSISNALIHHNLGVLSYKQSQWEEAEACWLQAIEEEPTLILPRLALIDLWILQKKWQKALNTCLEAKKIQPLSPHLLFQESKIWENLGDLANARACLLQIISGEVPIESPLNESMIHYHLGILSNKQGDKEEAEKQWSIAIEKDPHSAPSWHALISLWSSQQKWEKLSQELSLLKSSNPELAKALLHNLPHSTQEFPKEM